MPLRWVRVREEKSSALRLVLRSFNGGGSLADCVIKGGGECKQECEYECEYECG